MVTCDKVDRIIPHIVVLLIRGLRNLFLVTVVQFRVATRGKVERIIPPVVVMFLKGRGDFFLVATAQCLPPHVCRTGKPTGDCPLGAGVTCQQFLIEAQWRTGRPSTANLDLCKFDPNCSVERGGSVAEYARGVHAETLSAHKNMRPMRDMDEELIMRTRPHEIPTSGAGMLWPSAPVSASQSLNQPSSTISLYLSACSCSSILFSLHSRPLRHPL